MIRQSSWVQAISLAGIAVLAGGATLFAAPKPLPATPERYSSPPQGADSQFSKEAAEGGIAEVKMGHLAEERGDNQAVKEFGKRMVDDHGAANHELMDIASRENMSLPAGLDSHDQTVYDELAKLNGPQFDRAYTRMMVRDHEKDVAAFKKEADTGNDGAVKSFAAKTLPTLEEHLKLAREMLRQVGGSTGAAGH
jgi:putative membrane protein